MTRPPGRVRCSDLMMKWLWMLCPDRLCRGSCRVTSPKGTLPMTRSKEESGRRVAANEPGMIVALRVEGRGDRGGLRLQLDAGHVRGRRGEADEVAAAAARLQNLAAREAEVLVAAVHMAWTRAASV